MAMTEWEVETRLRAAIARMAALEERIRSLEMQLGQASQALLMVHSAPSS